MTHLPLSLAFLLAGATCTMAAPDTTTLEYVVHIPAAEAGLARVELTVSNPPRSGLELSLPESFAYTALSEPQLLGGVQAVGIERIDPFHWTVPAPAEGDIRVSWSVPLEHRTLEAVPVEDAYEFPYLAIDHGMLVAGALLLAPLEMQDVSAMRASVRFELPETWSVLSPWPQNEQGAFVPRGMGDLHNDLFAIGAPGAWQTHKIQSGGCEVTVAIAPTHVGLLERVGEPIGKLVAAELKLFQRLPRERYLFLFGRSEYAVQPGAFYLGGSPKGSSMTLLFGGDVGPGGTIPAAIIRENVSHLIAHEFFHTWTAPDIPYPDELRFVAEGFTDYYAYLLAARVGLSSMEAFVATLGDNMGTYLKAAGEQSLSDAGGPDFFQGGSAHTLCYSGGMSFAALCDRLIRNEGKGQTLDDFMRAFNNDARYLGSSAVVPTAKDFFTLLGTFLGNAAATRLEAAALAKDPLDLAAEFEAAGVSLEVSMAAEKPSLRANLRGTTIVDIDPSGLGGSLGLVAGDEFKTVNGEECKEMGDVFGAWASPVDGRMTFTYVRGGLTIHVDEELEPTALVRVPTEGWS